MNSARIAALKLHALHPEDKEWIFSRLDVTAQAALTPLLDELEELGFKADSDLINAVTDQQEEIAKPSSEESTSLLRDELSVINSASFSQIELLFDQEPAVFQQTLMMMHPWRWAGSASGQPSGASAATPTAVRKALLKIVAKKLTAPEYQLKVESDVKSLTDKESSFQQLFKKLFSW